MLFCALEAALVLAAKKMKYLTWTRSSGRDGALTPPFSKTRLKESFMLVRERMELDRRGMIPQFMKDAWTRKYGTSEPIEETKGIARLVWFDAVVSFIAPVVFIALLMAGFTFGVLALCVATEQWRPLVGLSICSFVSAFVAKGFAGAVTYGVQSRTKTNFFNCSLGNVRRWMKMGEGEHLGQYPEFELRHMAEQVLVDQAAKILALEWKTGCVADETPESEDLRREFRFKYRVLNDLGLVDCPWRRLFEMARERLQAKA